jgi:uncharacterized protein YggL (DUF469 family)
MGHELGVEFECVFHGDADEQTLDCFIDLMETRGWHYGGGWTPTGMSGVVEFKVTDWDRAAQCRMELSAWMNRAEWIASITQMKLIDVNVYE